MKSFIFFVSLFISASAFSSTTYSPVTLDAVAQGSGSSMVYVTKPVALDTAGFARTTGSVSTMGSRIGFPAVVRVARYPASLILRTAGRLCGPYCLLAVGAIELYDYFNSQAGLKKCSDPSKTGKWCVDVVPTGYTCAPNIVNGSFGCYMFSTDAGSIPGCSASGYSSGAASNVTYWFGVTPPAGMKTSCIMFSPSISQREAVDADFEKIAVPMPMPIVAASWPKAVGDQNLPIDAWGADSSNTQWLGEAYKGADGKWRRDAVTVNASNSTFPPVARVSTVTYGPMDSPDQLNTATPPTTGQDPDAVSDTDLCAINPNIIACADKEEVYSKLSPSSAVSSALTQQQFEESDTKFGKAVDDFTKTVSSSDSDLGADFDKLSANIAEIGTSTLPNIATVSFPEYATCKKISFTWNKQYFEFPNADQCEKMEQIKSMFGYFLAGLVIISLLWQLLVRPQG